MDTLTSSVLDSYLKAAEKGIISQSTLREVMEPNYAKKIEAAENPVEVARIVQEQIQKEMDESSNFEWDKFAPDYARKRTKSQPREDQLMEGSGEPFTPPVSTEDVAGL